MNLFKVKHYWKKELSKVSWLSWVIKMIPVPIEIITSMLIADIILKAVDGKVQEVFVYGIGLAGIVLCTRLFMGILDTIYRNKCSLVLHRCKISLYEAFLDNPLTVLYASRNGEAKEKLNDDFQTITDRDLKLYPEFGTALITAMIYLGYLFFLSPFIACALCMISFVQMIPPVIVKKYMQQNYEKNRDIEAEITDFIMEGIDGFVTIKLYHLKNWWMEHMKKLYSEYQKIGNRSIYTSEAEIAMNAFVSNILKYGTYGIIGLFVLYEYASLEAGIQAIALSANLFSAVKKVFSSIPRFAVVRIAEKRISSWYGTYPDRTGNVRNCEIQLSSASCSFEEKEVLQNFSAHWKANEITLIKGANGAGKSTLLKIITGLLPYQEGKVSVGGISPENFGAENFPANIYYLPQEDAVLSVTPLELYEMALGTFGKVLSGKDQNAVENAVRTAQKFGLTEEMIHQRQINELSGGERKKVYLALGFAVKPHILLLDEPVNSLDTEGKQVLCRLLKDYPGGAVIVTHEEIFDTLADNICCM